MKEYTLLFTPGAAEQLKSVYGLASPDVRVRIRAALAEIEKMLASDPYANSFACGAPGFRVADKCLSKSAVLGRPAALLAAYFDLDEAHREVRVAQIELISPMREE